MTETCSDARSFFATLAEMAEGLRQALVAMPDADRSKHVGRLVRDSTMVFGVWPDSGEPDGIGTQIIKGDEMLVPLDGFVMPEAVSVAAIPCVGLDQAAAARDAWMQYEHGGTGTVPSPAVRSEGDAERRA
jgi:hypothetical protein